MCEREHPGMLFVGVFKCDWVPVLYVCECICVKACMFMWASECFCLWVVCEYLYTWTVPNMWQPRLSIRDIPVVYQMSPFQRQPRFLDHFSIDCVMHPNNLKTKWNVILPGHPEASNCIKSQRKTKIYSVLCEKYLGSSISKYHWLANKPSWQELFILRSSRVFHSFHSFTNFRVFQHTHIRLLRLLIRSCTLSINRHFLIWTVSTPPSSSACLLFVLW